MKAFVTTLSSVLALAFSAGAQAYVKSHTEYETTWAKYSYKASIETNCRATFATFSARSGLELRNVRLQTFSVPGYMTISGTLRNGRSCAMNCSRGHLSEVYCRD